MFQHLITIVKNNVYRNMTFKQNNFKTFKRIKLRI